MRGSSATIRTIAGLPGGANLPLYDALFHCRQISRVLARREQAAGFMAQGSARATGRPEVCWATSGPGATHVLAAAAGAKKWDSIPPVRIAGQLPRRMIGNVDGILCMPIAGGGTSRVWLRARGVAFGTVHPASSEAGGRAARPVA